MERLNRLEEQQDKLMDKVQEIAISTAENTSSLKEHMNQTLEVRKQTEILQEMFKELKDQTNARIAPLETLAIKAKTLLTYLCYTGTIILAVDKLGLIDLILKIK